MRISEIIKEAIIEPVRNIDPDAKIWLFGSRAKANFKLAVSIGIPLL